MKVQNLLIIKEPNHITEEDHITGLHALDESLALCLLHDCLQDVKVATDSRAMRDQISKGQASA